MYTHNKNIIASRGPSIEEGGKALILLHGRGASANDILALKQYLNIEDFSLLAPEATNNSWYPYSFMAPASQNQPALDSALQLLDELVGSISDGGIESKDIYFLGFSQGACLTLEYTTRHAQRWGGIVAFTGGLIGETVNTGNYSGQFEQTPVLITTGNPDPHVPLQRVEESKRILEEMKAQLTVKVYKGRPHTIMQEELSLANSLVFKQ